ncbi:MAG: glycosyltransferase [Cyanobacteria bacterium]|nr:glycosyltransferase [Cyanobacteriota bacterium]
MHAASELTGRENRSQTLGVLVCTRNNQDVIGRLLASLAWAEHIVIVDCGSEDETIAIARQYTDTIVYTASLDWHQQVKTGLAWIKTDWVLYLEPDEWAPEMLHHEIDGILLQNKTGVDAYQLKLSWFFGDKALGYGRSSRKAALRLVKKSLLLNEQIGVSSQPYFRTFFLKTSAADNALDENVIIKTLDYPINKAPFQTYDSLFKSASAQGRLGSLYLAEARGLNPALSNPLTALIHTKWAFFKYYILQLGILDGLSGLAFSGAQSWATFLKYVQHQQLCLSALRTANPHGKQ